MPYLLTDLVIDRVDLVDEGANAAAFIELYKRKERNTTMDLKDIIAKMVPEHANVIQAEIDKLVAEVAKLKETNGTLTTASETIEQELSKTKEELKTANDDLAKAKSELDKSSTSEETDEEILKAMPEGARELFIKMKEQKEAAEESVRKAADAEKHAVAVAKAVELKSLPIEQDKLVGIVKSCSDEVLEVLTTISEAMTDTVLGEIGKNNSAGAGSSNSAWDKIEAKAEEVAKASSLSKAKAISQVIDQNPELYKEYLQGGAN